ncbi:MULTISPECIES: cyclodeaminase/cyclohydrolase family protein [Romboutsia]|jgi:formiminotetrahydrofolate cyclodeaminase|uniref:Methenyltetrahydrofolate cyclohydrolase n=1 Tax=Romboutsia ilealis TaxID=1115758 RepID=A0A1V1HZ17_9FIRM|nr:MULTISPECIES: cyclodeaminase/cyclohydrolase family protein [Romboutsia]MCI9061697.1 cyclodeaminase/cyclohydrolase family protein [Romboutsia sp.]MCI9260647.1 cyclodeaminase/cyclohydrolase family protein [Romboutsia sp.]CED93127.1 Methenyltetrahydrofolate cyclohydrolase [Romboutsia ilealis]
MKLVDMTICEFSDEVDSKSPAPGGGSVSALAANIGVGLSRMMAHLSFGKQKYESLDKSIRVEFLNRFNQLSDIRQELVDLIDKDTESFNEFMKAIKLPKNTKEQINYRNNAIQDATLFSIDIPFKTAKKSLKALNIIDYILEYGNQNTITDLGVGVLMLYTGVEGAVLNVKGNLKLLENQELKEYYNKECQSILNQAILIKDSILSTIHNKL